MFESAIRMAATARRGGGFLARLFRDRRGNALVIAAAALFPLAAMIGSGVDMSRAYMAKQRLQTACDAAALAGRRVMQDDTMTTDVRDEAVRFFRFNFPQTTVPGSTPARTEGPYATEAVTPVVTRPEAGTVRVSASTRIPTTIMKMFGFTSLPLSVTCDASLHFVNTDVMLVLDTTGSMYCTPAEAGTCGRTVEISSSRIVALRAAVLALYDQLAPTQTQLEDNELRLRYGIVPYSSTVNVGGLLNAMDAQLLPAVVRNSMRERSRYQSREAFYNTPRFVANPSTVNGPYWEYYRSTAPYTTTTIGQATSLNSANCTKFQTNSTFTGFVSTPPNNGATAPTTRVDTTFPYDGSFTTGGTGEWGWTGAPVTTGTNRTCRRRRTDTTTTYVTRFIFTSWRYSEQEFDTSQLRAGSTILASNTGGTVATAGYYNEQQLPTVATTTSTTTVNPVTTVPGLTTEMAAWNGCIEERNTTDSIVLSSNPNDLAIPTAALDLNINLIPTNDDERWRPHWPRVLHLRTSSTSADYMGDNTNDTVACPSEARRMQAWTRDNLQAYVAGLKPRGYTYHDIGMIWGARLLSNAGVFGPDNPDTFNGMPVTRHIIFMTDGELMPQCDAYSAWGLEQLDGRVTTAATCTDTPGDMYNRHMQRFQMACDAARGRGFSVWVIAFGVGLTDEMRSCASNPNQASSAADSAALIARFRQIGANIGALRLTQ